MQNVQDIVWKGDYQGIEKQQGRAGGARQRANNVDIFRDPRNPRFVREERKKSTADCAPGKVKRRDLYESHVPQIRRGRLASDPIVLDPALIMGNTSMFLSGESQERLQEKANEYEPTDDQIIQQWKQFYAHKVGSLVEL